MNKELIYQNIRAQGGRITKIRSALIEIMLDEDCLISSPKLLFGLKKIKLEPNRSTIYRELKFLHKNNIITKNIIAGHNYYEINSNYKNFVNKTSALNRKHHHHHHLICLKCHLILRVEMENHLERQEEELSRKNNFNIVNHSLDFHGYCQKCRA